MRIVCSICLSIITQVDQDVYTTHCGHIFHGQCVKKWLEGSHTCPQCRKGTFPNSIIRIYLTEDVEVKEDLSQANMETLLLTIRIKERDIKSLTGRILALQEEIGTLSLKVANLEDARKGDSAAMKVLKEQLTHYKTKSKDKERLSRELYVLKQRLKTLESVQNILDSEECDLQFALEELTPNAMRVLVTALKKTLSDVQKVNKDLDAKTKRFKNEINQYKTENENLVAVISELRAQVKIAEKTIEQYKDHIDDVKNHQKVATINVSQAVISNANTSQTVDEPPTPVVPSNSETTEATNSPYLRLKSSSVGGLNANLERSKMARSGNAASTRLLPATKRKAPSAVTKSKKFRKLAPNKK